MDTATLAVTALGTGAATAVFNQAIAWWREARSDHQSSLRSARYLALRIALILETFAVDCAEGISAQDMHRQSGGHAGTPHGVMPKLPDYPEEQSWEKLEPSLLSRALTLRTELRMSDRLIEFWEDVDRECIPEECDDQSGKCGLMALCLAAEMRKAYGLPAFDPAMTSWNVARVLTPHNDRALKKASELQNGN